MALLDNFASVAGTLLAIIKTRSELLAIEMEEERDRFLSYLLLSLTALFCLSLAVLLCVLLVIVLCWDTCRIPAMIGMIVFFFVVAAVLFLRVKSSFRNRPKLFEQTRQEIAKDIDRLRPPV